MGSMFISLLRISFWFDVVCNIVTRWVNFRETICMNMNYNYPTTIYRSIFAQMSKFLVEKYAFTIFAYELVKVKMKNCKLYQKYLYCGHNTSIYCSQIIVVHVHANGFL